MFLLALVCKVIHLKATCLRVDVQERIRPGFFLASIASSMDEG